MGNGRVRKATAVARAGGMGCIAALLLACPTLASAAEPHPAIEPIIREDCKSCHGYDGVAGSESWPNLCSQNRGYLYSRLMHFKNSTEHAIDGKVRELTMEQIGHIADYYGSKPCPGGR